MKKFMMAAAALCCMTMAAVFTACTNDDNPVMPIGGKAVITVNTAALYNELNIADLMPQCLDNGIITIVDSVLIYDQTGNLVKKLGAETNTLQPLTIEAGDLSNGTYTLVAWQTARSRNGAIPWFLSGEEQLSTVNLYTVYGGLNYMWALGSASVTFTVENGSVEASVTPKSLGSIIELRVDNFTEDTDYTTVRLRGPNLQYVIGCRLAPSLTEEDRWILEREHNWIENVGKLDVGTVSAKFFTLTHGNKVWYDLYGYKEDGSSSWLLDGGYNLGTGENAIFYFDMSRSNWQPTFFGTYEDFAAWKADRDEGILVVDPYLNWGGNIDDVTQYVKAKQWWNYGNDKLELWESRWNTWHKWFYVAYLLTEQYLFETEDGQNLRYVLSICHDSSVPIDVANNSLLKQGYIYSGKYVFPGNDPCDIFFSADGKTEVQTMLYSDGRWEIYYQPANPDDFQYIIPAEEAAARSMVKGSPLRAPQQAPSALKSKMSDKEELSPKAFLHI